MFHFPHDFIVFLCIHYTNYVVNYWSVCGNFFFFFWFFSSISRLSRNYRATEQREHLARAPLNTIQKFPYKHTFSSVTFDNTINNCIWRFNFLFTVFLFFQSTPGEVHVPLRYRSIRINITFKKWEINKNVQSWYIYRNLTHTDEFYTPVVIRQEKKQLQFF